MTIITVLVQPTGFMRVGMRTHAGNAMANAALLRVGRTRMTIVTVLVQPAGFMRIGMRTQARHAMAGTALLLRIGRTRMTIVTVRIQPIAFMRTGMRTYAGPAMANTARFRRDRARMAVVTVRIQPAGRMRIGMRTYAGHMAQRTTRSRTPAGMTIIAMVLGPRGIVGLWPGGCVTGRAGILLMTDQTALAVPRGLHAVGLQTPKVVVRGGLCDLVALPARLFAVADSARIIRLSAHGAVSPRPVLAMAGRRSLPIHVFMACGTAHAPTVGLIADTNFLLVRQLRDQFQFLIQ